jgi:carbamoyl-phosphate synthase large subunit
MRTILITGIGGDIAQSIATILIESYPEIRLIGTDISTRHAGYLLVNKVFIMPVATSEKYLDSMRALIKEQSVDIVIPTNEQELSVFSPLIDELGEDRCITAGVKVLDIGLDKLKTKKFIASLGIPVPWTISAEENKPLKFPCIFKARSGSGSKNIFKVDSQDEVSFLVGKYPHSIFQESLEPEGQEVTCAVYRTRDGRISVLQLLRKLTEGTTSWAKVINNKEALEMCIKIAKGAALQGSMNIQLILTDSGPRIFEINPRFSSTVLMRHKLGFCDLLWSLDEIKGLNINFPSIEVGKCMVRTQGVSFFSHGKSNE